jgi:hypothetical protein
MWRYDLPRILIFLCATCGDMTCLESSFFCVQHVEIWLAENPHFSLCNMWRYDLPRILIFFHMWIKKTTQNRVFYTWHKQCHWKLSLMDCKRMLVSANFGMSWLIEWFIYLFICIWVWALKVPMHLGLIDSPFVPHINSVEPCCFITVPDGPQTCTLNL